MLKSITSSCSAFFLDWSKLFYPYVTVSNTANRYATRWTNLLQVFVSLEQIFVCHDAIWLLIEATPGAAQAPLLRPGELQSLEAFHPLAGSLRFRRVV